MRRVTDLMSNIQLLDCTLRDGAHLNSGNFGEKLIRETITNLVRAKIDIIEVGFFMNQHYGINSTYFDSIADVKKILPADKGSSKFSLMADFVDVSKIEPYDGTIDFFRLSFKRHRLEWGLNAARILMDKGYKCYINPVNCNVYSDAEYLRVIEKVNELKPYGFSIVDTFGVLRLADLSRIYYLLEGNLDSEIAIGVHLHENLGMAFSLAQHFLNIKNPKRNVSIDGSLLGMGRVPGNLCMEQIMDHMNINYGTEYNTEPALDIIDDYIAPIKKEIPWGYSIPYALSGKYGVHRTYAEYLMGKNRLKTKDIQRLLSSIDEDHIEMFDENYIEYLYRKYMEVQYDDLEDMKDFQKELIGKNVVVICPGASINECHRKLKTLVECKNNLTISVNFVPDDIHVEYAFCANAKRLGNLQDKAEVKKIVTSNLIESMEMEFEYAFSYNNCVYFNEVFCEDSTLMLLKILQNCGCRAVSIAGFDGFSYGKNNYYQMDYTKETGTYIETKKVQHILEGALGDMSITFLTPSIYDEAYLYDKQNKNIGNGR